MAVDDKRKARQERRNRERKLLARLALKMRVAKRKPKHMAKVEWDAVPTGVRFRIVKALERAEAKTKAYRARAIVLAKSSDLEIGPTPETIAHARAENTDHHPVLGLFLAGAISRDDLNAAYEIAYAYRMRTADVSVKLSSYETRIDSGGWREQPPDSKNQARIQAAYLAWCARVRRQRLNLDAVIEIIAHGVSLRRIMSIYRIGRLALRRDVIRALTLYEFNSRRS